MLAEQHEDAEAPATVDDARTRLHIEERPHGPPAPRRTKPHAVGRRGLGLSPKLCARGARSWRAVAARVCGEPASNEAEYIEVVELELGGQAAELAQRPRVRVLHGGHGFAPTPASRGSRATRAAAMSPVVRVVATPFHVSRPAATVMRGRT